MRGVCALTPRVVPLEWGIARVGQCGLEIIECLAIREPRIVFLLEQSASEVAGEGLPEAVMDVEK
jgi:hypothetical protein